jgi:hypothetical protein
MKTLTMNFRAVAAIAILLSACGGGLDEKYEKPIFAAARAESLAMHLCNTDAGCDTDSVYTLSRAAYCDNAGVLYSAKKTVPDAGVSCLPQ